MPKSKIQKSHHNPKSHTIQNPKSPQIPTQKSKIQNPQNPKSKIQNPSFFGRILGILDLGLGILGILDFGILRSKGCTTRQFGGRCLEVRGSESPLVCLWGPLQNQLYLIELGQGSKYLWTSFQRSEPYKITEKPWLPTKRSELYKITEKPRLPTHFKTNLDEPSDHTPENRRKLKK